MNRFEQIIKCNTIDDLVSYFSISEVCSSSGGCESNKYNCGNCFKKWLEKPADGYWEKAGAV